MPTIALIIDWCGPHKTIEAASMKARELGFQEALYMAGGKLKSQRNAALQYVGVSLKPSRRISPSHHKVSKIVKDREIWIGEISSHAIAGRRASKHTVAHSRAIELAEWALAYFLQLPLNERKRRKPPKESVVLVNRWWKTDFETRWTKRSYSEWSDFLEYYREYDFARLQWFGAGGRGVRLTKSGIKGLAIRPQASRGA